MRPTAFLLLAGITACAHKPITQQRWWREYGFRNGCAVVSVHEPGWIDRRGRAHAHGITCYRCDEDEQRYCFGGPPVPGAIPAPDLVLPDVPPDQAPAPGGPPPDAPPPGERLRLPPPLPMPEPMPEDVE